MRSISKTFTKTSIVVAAVGAENGNVKEIERTTVETFETVTSKNALKLAKATSEIVQKWEDDGYSLVILNQWEDLITYRMSAEDFMKYGEIDGANFID